MFKYIYGTTRSRHYNSSLTLGEISMNGGYTTEFFNNGQFKDFEEAGITKLSMPIPNDRYTGVIPKIDENEEIIGTVPKLTRFVMLRYSDKFTNAEDLKSSIEKSSSDTSVQMFSTTQEAIDWVHSNTSLLSIGEGKFLILEEHIGIMGETIPASYLVID